MSDVLRCPVCSCAHFLVHIARETAGAARIRHSLRPLTFVGQELLAKIGRKASRECESMSTSLRAQRSNPCRRRKAERMDCFATLAMTGIGHGVLDHPLSRVTTAECDATSYELHAHPATPLVHRMPPVSVVCPIDNPTIRLTMQTTEPFPGWRRQTLCLLLRIDRGAIALTTQPAGRAGPNRRWRKKG
jgi:hypothetical protein